MKPFLILAALGALAACSGGSRSTEAYTCPNGPEIAVSYSDQGATVVYSNGRSELIPPAGPDEPDVYAKPGMVWEITAFRSARLTDETSSYHCDQLS